MKKTWLSIIIIMIVALFGVFYMLADRLDMKMIKDVDVYFTYDDIKEVHRLEDNEVQTLKTIFEGKKIYIDNPSCGFSEMISIKFDKNQTFCIARDTCPIIYWKEKDRYIKLSEDEKVLLYNLLEQYGFFFPCI